MSTDTTAPDQETTQTEEPMLEGPKVEDVIEVIQDPETISKLNTLFADAQAYLLTWNVLTELVIIAAALFIGLIIRRFSSPPLQRWIDEFSFPFALKHVLKNISKLTFHVGALSVLFLCVAGMASLQPEWDIRIISATTKLLSAWIFIRLFAQIILNNFLRNVLATAAWGIAALSVIGLLDPFVTALDSIGFTMGDTRLTLLSVIKAVIIVTLLLALAMFIGKMSEQQIRRSASLTPSAQVLIGKLLKVVLIGIAFLFGITLSGLDLSSLAIFGGALGLGIGFGLQKVISNLFSGILLLSDRSIKPGDIIEMQDGTFGWIGQLNARYVSIVTRDNKEYLVPNEDFVTQPVINWSFTNRLIRIETKFGVHYNSDPHLVKKLAQEAAATPERVVAEPAPVCHLVEFGDSSLNFVLRYWIEDAEKGVTNTKGAVMLALWDVFKENGIEIPYPHREVFMHGTRD